MYCLEFDPSSILAVIWKLAQALVTWMLVILGWLIISDQSQRREIAQNYYKELARLRTLLSTLEEQAIEHHTGGYEAKRVHQILRELSNLGIEITHLAKRKCVGVGASTYVFNLRQAITSNNFDVSTFELQQPGSSLLLEIEAQKDLFDRLLLESMETVIFRRQSIRDMIRETVKRL